MNAADKRLLRGVVRRVHPDLFAEHPDARDRNSESLKALNAYLDTISRSIGDVKPVKLHFLVRAGGDGSELVAVRAELPAWGSLGPLFYAFNLISEDQLLAGIGRCKTGEGDINVLSWLGQSADAATKAADEHEALRGSTRELRARLEDRFELVSVQLSNEFSASVYEQRRQLEALHTLEACLTALSLEQPDEFRGLSIKVYHPDSDSLQGMAALDADSAFTLRGAMKSAVGQDGTLHIVADRATIQAAFASLDLHRARILTQVACFWVRRSRDLTAAVRKLLGVQRVWCDARTEHASQRFVLWAGNVFAQRRLFQEVLAGQEFRFSLLIHCDDTAPAVDFNPASATLQVRVDTQPQQLMDFMAGSSGLLADEAAADAEALRQEEEAVLGQVREALGVRHVIRVCSNSEKGKVIAAARRLLANAPRILAAGIDLRGASLAIDDCYEVWESGFISIPHNFRVEDLQPRLQRLLGGPEQAAPAVVELNSALAAAESESRVTAAEPRAAPAGGPPPDDDGPGEEESEGEEGEPQTMLEALQAAAERRAEGRAGELLGLSGEGGGEGGGRHGWRGEQASGSWPRSYPAASPAAARAAGRLPQPRRAARPRLRQCPHPSFGPLGRCRGSAGAWL